MSTTGATIHVPILLDVSGNVEVFGEKVVSSTNFFDAQHYFKADCHDSGNKTGEGVTATQLKNLLKFQDADQGDALFSIGHAQTDNGLTEKKALLVGLRKALCGTKETNVAETSECCLIHVVEDDDMPTGATIAASTGYAGENGKVLKQNDVAYASSITSTSAAEQTLGDAVLRYVSTHLSGHPLGQAFVKNDAALIAQINGGVDESDSANIEGSAGSESFKITPNVLGANGFITAATANACLPEQIVNALTEGLSGGTTGEANGAVTPGSNNIVKSIYEQMLGQKAERFEALQNTTDNGTGSGDQNPIHIPFEANDTLVLYVRINVQTEVDSNVFQGADASPSIDILTEIFKPSQFKRMTHTYTPDSNSGDDLTVVFDTADHNANSTVDNYTYSHSILGLNTWRIDLKIGDVA
tara:strand:+ start:117 stop:1358 length:1242 start_codon:yes stop_codon:yes gene_type:complete